MEDNERGNARTADRQFSNGEYWAGIEAGQPPFLGKRDLTTAGR
jgi:hypothetical protein